MVTARQPAGFWPSLLPAVASQEPCGDLAPGYPLGWHHFNPGEVTRKDQTGHWAPSKESRDNGYREEPQDSSLKQKKQEL